jgi:hypothetical protein
VPEAALPGEVSPGDLDPDPGERRSVGVDDLQWNTIVSRHRRRKNAGLSVTDQPVAALAIASARSTERRRLLFETAGQIGLGPRASGAEDEY